MESLNNIRNKREVIEEFFKWVLNQDKVDLYDEVDLTLVRDYYDPNIYYSKGE